MQILSLQESGATDSSVTRSSKGHQAGPEGLILVGAVQTDPSEAGCGKEDRDRKDASKPCNGSSKVSLSN